MIVYKLNRGKRKAVVVAEEDEKKKGEKDVDKNPAKDVALS